MRAILTKRDRRDAYRDRVSAVDPMTRRSMSQEFEGEHARWTSSPTCLPVSSTSWVGSSDQGPRAYLAASPRPRGGRRFASPRPAFRYTVEYGHPLSY